jgi:endonuclease YncB( thermonuclease family)
MTRPQEIRKEILMQLYASRPLALTPELITRQGRKAGLDYSENEVRAECAFLHGQELAQMMVDPGTGATKYAITSRGTIYHEQA